MASLFYLPVSNYISYSDLCSGATLQNCKVICVLNFSMMVSINALLHHVWVGSTPILSVVF